MNLSHRRCMNRHFTPYLWRGTQEPLTFHLVQNMKSTRPSSHQEEGFSQLARHFLQDAMTRHHERLLIEHTQTQRQQSHPRPISTRFCLLHQTAASQSRKQAMDTRLRHIECSTNGRHTATGRRSAKVEKNFDGFVDGSEGLQENVSFFLFRITEH